jgi:hypothetical protein
VLLCCCPAIHTNQENHTSAETTSYRGCPCFVLLRQNTSSPTFVTTHSTSAYHCSASTRSWITRRRRNWCRRSIGKKPLDELWTAASRLTLLTFRSL